MRLRLFINIRYSTPTLAHGCQFEARLMPISDEYQRCTAFHIYTKPHTSITSIETPAGRIGQFSFPEPIHEFSLTAEAVVNILRHDPFDGLKLDVDDSEFYQNLASREELEHPFILPIAAAKPDLDRIISAAKQTSGVGAASFVISLTRLLNRAYVKLITTSHGDELNTETALNLNLLMMYICHSERIPVRFVSGCIFNSDIRGEDSLQGWVECLMPDGRWHGFDLLSNQIVNDRYIRLYIGSSPGNTYPISGRYKCSEAHKLHTLIRITPDV